MAVRRIAVSGTNEVLAVGDERRRDSGVARTTGFEEIETSLEAAPIVLPDAETFRVFVTNVICSPHLARLPDQVLKVRFSDALTQLAMTDDPPLKLDCWRLNMRARKRGGRTVAELR